MSADQSFDVIVVGGGIAGSALAGVLARAGLGVLLVEREAAYRDRIRGELTWCWGVAEARRTGLDAVMERTGSVQLAQLQTLQNRNIESTYVFPGEPVFGFSHPTLQGALFTWAESLGATALRPAKAISFSGNARPEVRVMHGGNEVAYSARLVVAADGKTSAARRWTGGESVTDPEHHRFGGVLLAGLRAETTVFHDASVPEVSVFWFAAGAHASRVYLRLSADKVGELGVDRSLDAFLAHAARFMPDGTLDDVQQVGPLGFFSNSNTWASTIAGEGIVLIGDAAGAADPSLGHGTSLVFRDVRELSELLLGDQDWPAAIKEFARRRAAYYAVVRARDRWFATVSCETGEEADRRRERHERAKELDPTLAGFANLEENGPDGLVPDEAARRHYFGEDLA